MKVERLKVLNGHMLVGLRERGRGGWRTGDRWADQRKVDLDC